MTNPARALTTYTQLELAKINSEECIGCGRCLEACPVDAIIGSKQWLHQVLDSECIGCKLCLAPCPVDCIDLIAITITRTEKLTRSQQAKNRYTQKQARLNKNLFLPSPDLYDPKRIRAHIQEFLKQK